MGMFWHFTPCIIRVDTMYSYLLYQHHDNHNTRAHTHTHTRMYSSPSRSWSFRRRPPFTVAYSRVDSLDNHFRPRLRPSLKHGSKYKRIVYTIFKLYLLIQWPWQCVLVYVPCDCIDCPCTSSTCFRPQNISLLSIWVIVSIETACRTAQMT